MNNGKIGYREASPEGGVPGAYAASSGEMPGAYAAVPGGAPGATGSYDAPDSSLMPNQPSKKRGMLRSTASFILTIVVIVVVAVVLRTFFFQSYEIPSSSMENTIMTGDLVFTEKLSYYMGEPEQGDIVTFTDPEIPSRTLIKRVIATGGQTVDLQDGHVYIDGVRQAEPYTLSKPTWPLSNSLGEEIEYPYTVPEGELWVMGDNRTNSQDSRYFGSIPISSVQGKAVLIYWPLNEIGTLK